MFSRSLLLLLIVCLGFSAQSQEINFNPNNRQLNFFKKHNFDPFYQGNDLQINHFLFSAYQAKKSANVIMGTSGVLSILPTAGPYLFVGGMALGTYVNSGAMSELRTATELNLKSLTSGKTYTGTELFRKKFRAKWYTRKNFQVDYYHGKNLLINGHLERAWKLKNTANQHFVLSGITGVTGGTLLLLALLNAVFGDEGSRYETSDLLLSGIVLSSIGSALFISSDRKRNEAQANLWHASELWYTELHGKPNQ